jgi:ATP-dependent Clp protease ATP-binding subunit ClpB
MQSGESSTASSGSGNSVNEPGVQERRRSRPAWLETLVTGLSIHSHFAMSGNVRDLFPVETQAGLDFLPFEEVVRGELKGVGIETVLTFDPIEGIDVHGRSDQKLRATLDKVGAFSPPGTDEASRLEQLIRSINTSPKTSAGLIINYASHLTAAGDADLERLLVVTDKITRWAALRSPTVQRIYAPHHNPIIWILDRPGDLPDWFVIGNHCLRQIRVDLPDLEDRFAFSKLLADKFHDVAKFNPSDQVAALQQFALQTEGMALTEMSAVAELAVQQSLGLNQTGDAIRIYRTGIRRNPWGSPILMERLKQGGEILGKRVKGQDHAIAKALQILIRSAIGLSGSQTSSRLNRPRGVMFFAGPTGVGKTELAKSITELLFGDEALCQRFDMTEFSSERSVSRLIGAPPGYVGHELGGELTNAVQRRPFSVILFDEIEKAHPRILDMFMQILDEGRLTDSRGETCYFSDSFIIFTSNVGVIGDNTATNMGMEILPSDSYVSLRSKLLEGVRKYFVQHLRRPELLNRIGQNVVAFDFIHSDSAKMIFTSILERVVKTVLVEHGVEVVIGPKALSALASLCMSDWLDGGRGIANQIETNFVNPLAEALLEHRTERVIRIEEIECFGDEVRLIFGSS